MSQDKFFLEKELIKALYLHDQAKIDKILADVNLNVEYEDEVLHKRLLIHAIEQGNFIAVEKLLKRNANVNSNVTLVTQERCITPLQAAIKKQRKDLVELLLQFGADPGVECYYPGTIMHEAAKQGNLEILELCFEHSGSDEKILREILNQANEHSQKPFDCALEYGHPQLIQFFHSHQAVRGDRVGNLTKKYTEVIIQFLAELAHLKATNAKGTVEKCRALCEENFGFEDEYSILSFAVHLGHWKIAKLLYEQGFRKHFTLYYEGLTLLHLAVDSGIPETIAWVLSVPELHAEKDLNRFDVPNSSYATTPFARAVVMQRGGATLQYFLAHGLKRGLLPNIKNSSGGSALLGGYTRSNFLPEYPYLMMDLGVQSATIEPYPKEMDQERRVCHENYKFMRRCYTEKHLKLLIMYIDAEYFKRSQDIFRNKHPELLRNLIRVFAKHAAKVLCENKSSDAEIMKILEQSLVNRLEAVFFDVGRPRKNMEALLPYLSFKLAQHESLKAKPDRSHLFQKMSDKLSHLDVVSFLCYKENVLDKLDCSLHYAFDEENGLSDNTAYAALEYLVSTPKISAKVEGIAAPGLGLEVKGNAEIAQQAAVQQTAAHSSSAQEKKREVEALSLDAEIEDLGKRKGGVAWNKTIQDPIVAKFHRMFFTQFEHMHKARMDYVQGRFDKLLKAEAAEAQVSTKGSVSVPGVDSKVEVERRIQANLATQTGAGNAVTVNSAIPLSEREKLLVRFFSCIDSYGTVPVGTLPQVNGSGGAVNIAELGRQGVQLDLLRDQVIAAYGPETMQRAALMLLAPIAPPMDPRPMFTAYLQSLQSRRTAVSPSSSLSSLAPQDAANVGNDKSKSRVSGLD